MANIESVSTESRVFEPPKEFVAQANIKAADFDALGRCFVRFIRPASAATSVCHNIQIFQGTTLVGELR